LTRGLKMKAKSIILIVLGILGGIFVYVFDIIAGKPVNDITGPKSISAFVLCGALIAIGIYLLLKKSKG
jgi:hypothetical protein